MGSKANVDMGELEQLKIKRTRERAKATKHINELKTLFKQVHEDNQSPARYELDYAVEIGESHLSLLQDLEAQLKDAGAEDAESSHIADLHRAIGLGKRLLSGLREQAAAPAAPTPQHQASFKIDFNLPKFSGDLLAWPEFWEIYEASVHKNLAYSPVQKFLHLKQHLDGAAARAIQGLPLTAENYPEAVKILQDRFGKDGVRKDTLVAKLLGLPAVTDADNIRSLRRLTDDVTAGVRALRALNAASIGEMLLPVLKSKIPAPWRLQWARMRRERATEDGNEFEEFLKFLQQEVECQEESVHVSCQKRSEESSQPATRATTSVLSTQRVNSLSKKRWACPVCKGQHRLYRCAQYQELSVDDRWLAVKRAGACFQCLGQHHVRDCQSGTCRHCHRPHHSSLHRPSARTSDAVQSNDSPGHAPADLRTAAPTAPPAAQSHPSDQQACRAVGSEVQPTQPNLLWRYSAQSAKEQRSYLQTALVEGLGPQCTKTLRVLLDGGSDASYIRTSVADEMNLAVIDSGTFACIGFQERAEEPRTYNRVSIELKSRHGGEAREFRLWTSDRLCAPIPPADMPAGVAEDFVLADDFSGGDIDILIGSDQFYRAVLIDSVVLGERLRALDTIFGYVIHGVDSSIYQPPRHAYHCRQVDQMWDLDTIGIVPESENGGKALPEPTWNQDENRYEMGLLWSSEQRPVNNQHASIARTNRMTHKLDNNKLEEYHSNISKLHEDAVVEASPASENQESAFFLPHRGLHRNNKLRIVFDGSARDGVGTSLNSYLQAGDNLLRRLVAVLLTFRTHHVACQADIKAAFHQILVKEEDRKYLQFMWQDQALRFRRVPFGLTCSPYMLLRSIQSHLELYQSKHPELCDMLSSGLYMDDVAVGFEAVGEAEKQMVTVQKIFNEAGMEMHKVRMTGMPSDDNNILGMKWQTEADTLSVVIPAAASPKTKRQLLSVISKPFDPLGILSPWVVKGKILFQQTWLDANCPSWDSTLPPETGAQVEKWWNETKTIQEVEIPRSMGHLCDSTSFHVFCDASSKAYCAVVYAIHEGESRVVIAKTRLAPIRPCITIPRLELMAALIGVRLMQFVLTTLGIKVANVRYWTDSMDVLYWIWSKKPLKVFVKNRVSAILEDSKPEQWSYVETAKNPADLGTRGITLRNLISSEVWRKGPPLLHHPDEEGADETAPLESLVSDEAMEEFKKTSTTSKCLTTVTTLEEADSTLCNDTGPFELTNCSTLKQAIHKTAWIQRFIHNARSKREDRILGPLRPEERRQALLFWIKHAQRAVYHKEIQDLSTGRDVSQRSSLRYVRAHLDGEGVLRATPRTGEPAVIILPDLRYITTLIVDQGHRLCFHQGVRSTLALLSAEYLVRRKTVRRTVETCTRCRRYRALPYQQPEGGLPEFRTQPSRSFERIGIDYFGPLYIDNGSKVWGLLITCATTRAIHLEVVKSQSTEDLQTALRRFFALRGTPSLIVSDNAKSFHKIIGLLPASVRWQYIPEASPWWGGFWERLVGSVKAAMRVTLHQCHLSHEELVTIFYELAMQLNLRPLTEDVNDGLLTPAHFLFGVASVKGVVCPVMSPTTTLCRAWRNRKRIAEHLIKRWTSEYLQSLRTWCTSPRGRPTRTPQIGEIVLVHGEGSRGSWPLGRVLSLIRGADGNPRAAVIALRGRRTRRPVSKLYRLEAATENADQDDPESHPNPNPEDTARGAVTGLPCASPETDQHPQMTRSGRLVRPVDRLGV